MFYISPSSHIINTSRVWSIEVVAYFSPEGQSLRRESWGCHQFSYKVLKVIQPNIQGGCPQWERETPRAGALVTSHLPWPSLYPLAAPVLVFWRERRGGKCTQLWFGPSQSHFPGAISRELSFRFTFCWRTTLRILGDIPSWGYLPPQRVPSDKQTLCCILRMHSSPPFFFN